MESVLGLRREQAGRMQAARTLEHGLRLAEAFGLPTAAKPDSQELCFAAQRRGILVVLQGMDTSGKDGVPVDLYAPL